VQKLDLSGLLGTFRGTDRISASAWSEREDAVATAVGDVRLAGGLVVQSHETSRVVGDFSALNVFLPDPETGEVIDFVGGRADLKAGLVRAIGDAEARIKEDRLRMLRAARFAAQLGFTVAPGVLAAMNRMAPRLIMRAGLATGGENPQRRRIAG